MTITVTIEELRDYELRVGTWGGKRALVIEKTIVNDVGMDGFSCRTNTHALADWDRANPFPKLIPSI